MKRINFLKQQNFKKYKYSKLQKKFEFLEAVEFRKVGILKNVQKKQADIFKFDQVRLKIALLTTKPKNAKNYKKLKKNRGFSYLFLNSPLNFE